MGGIGSGRRNQSGKDTTDDYRALDVRRLQRDGRLTPGNAFGWNWTRNGATLASIHLRTEAEHVILDYRYKSCGDWQAKEYPVSLEWNDCTLGRRRAWFLCPAQGCGRRVAISILAARASSPVVTATSWRMSASEKVLMIECCVG